MRHKLIVEVPEAGPVTLIEPFEAGGLGAEVFSHITLVCQRLAPLPASQLDRLRSALQTGPLWGAPASGSTAPAWVAGQISRLLLLTEQPNGDWAPAHAFELGRS